MGPEGDHGNGKSRSLQGLRGGLRDTAAAGSGRSARAAQYLAIEGRGAPGGIEFVERLGCLYNVAFTIKMARKFAGRDYAVCKLEGLWWGRARSGISFLQEPKERWRWELMIRTPDFIGQRDLIAAVDTLRQRGKPAEVVNVRLRRLDEGRSVQMLHVGSTTTSRRA